MSEKSILPVIAAHRAALIETRSLAFQDDPAICCPMRRSGGSGCRACFAPVPI
jgi:mevalonate pyrophosphate decarboxylase